MSERGVPFIMSDSPLTDIRFMRAALALGRRGLGATWPNPAVGCLIVRHEDGERVIVGRGWTKPGGRPHAETEALSQAGDLAKGATAYVTLEPCAHHGATPPCAQALISAGVARVVSAMRDPDPRVAGQGIAMLRQAGIDVEEGVCEDEARQAHLGHILRVTQGRPAVTLKMALSADGKVAGPGGRPVRITCEDATARVHMMRAMSDAVMIGAGTARRDDPRLTVRLPGMEGQSPVRVVLDTNLSLDVQSYLVTSADEGAVWILAGEGADEKAEAKLREAQVEVIRVSTRAGVPGAVIDIRSALRALAERGITRLLCEGGPILAAALIEENMADEAVLFRSPDSIGEGIDAFCPETLARFERQLPVGQTHHAGRDTMTFYQRAWTFYQRA